MLCPQGAALEALSSDGRSSEKSVHDTVTVIL